VTTPYHAKYLAHELTKRVSADNAEKLSQSLCNATVDLNPHQIEAALFAFRSPLSRGAILADEVGLGKTIEAGLIISQLWAERKRRIICIVPAALRKQWNRELAEKFFIDSRILETRSFNEYQKRGGSNPFLQGYRAIICSYQFARARMAEVQAVPWDLVVIDESHRLRNVYKKSNKIARALRDGIGSRPKVLLTATPLQNSLMELYGLVTFIDPHNPGCVNTTNYILLYAKDKSAWKPNRVFTGRERDRRYGQFIANVDDDYESWRIVTLTKAFADAMGISVKEARKIAKDDPEQLESFVLNNARNVIRTARPDYEGVSEAARSMIDTSRRQPKSILRLQREDHSDMYFKGGERILFYSDKLKLVDGQQVAGEPLTTLWDDILSNNLHNEGGVDFPKGKKPEALIKRVPELTTRPGDWVLDSFAGSGTTGAVAHKMHRRWIMAELREHCHTHILPRLKAVVEGKDASGITGAVAWKEGGGFRYFRLAPSLLEKDRFGNWIISKQYNAAMLAEAVCKLQGFRYAPSETVYWQHGRSTENDFIYVTTQTLNRGQIAKLSEEVGPKQSLLVMCCAFRCNNLSDFANLTVKKIPKAVLGKCEWGKDDYSLEIKNLPALEPAAESDNGKPGKNTRQARKARERQQEPALFNVDS